MQGIKPDHALSESSIWGIGSARSWLIFATSIFLVSVPVFVQAPLVRSLPWLGLSLTGGWLIWGSSLLSRPATRIWGDLLIGFTLSWLAGSLYWGWLRWEPLLHLPVEAIGLPLVLWGFKQNWYKVGSFFYLGSLFGTAITDLYFYVTDLIPYWRELMQVDPISALTVLQEATLQVATPWGIGWAAALAVVLLVAGFLPLTLPGVWEARLHQLHWWAFAGAVLSTILVDGLFWLTASTV